MKPLLARLATVLVLSVPATLVAAAPIQFVFSGQISGVTEPAIFQPQIAIANAPFKIVLNADTEGPWSVYSYGQLLASAGTFAIDGLGTAVAAAPGLGVEFGAGSQVPGLQLYWNDASSPMFWFSGNVLANGYHVLDESAASSPVNLLTPLTDASGARIGSFPYTVALQFPNVGRFGISELSNVTFSASLVPEPASAWMAALGSIMLVRVFRRRATSMQ